LALESTAQKSLTVSAVVSYKVTEIVVGGGLTKHLIKQDKTRHKKAIANPFGFQNCFVKFGLNPENVVDC